MTSFISLTLAVLLHSVRGLAPNYNTDRVLASQEVRAGTPPQTLQEMATSPNIARLMRVFPSESFAALFPNANKDAGPGATPYNYFNLVAAAWKFPHFCGEPDQTVHSTLHIQNAAAFGRPSIVGPHQSSSCKEDQCRS